MDKRLYWGTVAVAFLVLAGVLVTSTEAMYDWPENVTIAVGEGYYFGDHPSPVFDGCWVFYQGEVHFLTVPPVSVCSLRLFGELSSQKLVLDLEIEQGEMLKVSGCWYVVDGFNSTHVVLVKMP